MKEKENIEGLYSPAGCLTLETMKRYHATSLSPKEKTHVDKHLKSCELCSDALEGLLLVSNPEKIDSIVSEINENLRSNLPTKKPARTIRLTNRMYYMAAAASVIIFIGVFSYFRFYIQDQDTQLSVVTEKAEDKKGSNFKSIDEDKKVESTIEKESEEIIPLVKEETGEKDAERIVEDQFDISTKESEPVVEITMNEAPVVETDDKNAVQVIEDAIQPQPSAIIESEEPTEYVIEGVALNGKGQELESLSFDEDLSEDQEQNNSRKDSKRSNKKEKRNYVAESTSGNYYQDDTTQKEGKPIFIVVEEMPEFPGEVGSLNKYITNNIYYPDSAREAGIQGTVHVSFVVNKFGKIEDAIVVRGIGGGCDEEALRLVESFPDWYPGKQRGKPVKVQMTLPINFKLTN